MGRKPIYTVEPNQENYFLIRMPQKDALEATILKDFRGWSMAELKKKYAVTDATINKTIKWVKASFSEDELVKINQKLKDVDKEKLIDEYTKTIETRNKIITMGEELLLEEMEKRKFSGWQLSRIISDTVKRKVLEGAELNELTKLKSIEDEELTRRIKFKFEQLYIGPEKGTFSVVAREGETAQRGENQVLDTNRETGEVYQEQK